MHSCVRPYKTMYNLTRPFETLPSRQPTDTCQTPSIQFPNIFQTPTRQTPKFRHVGSFLPLEARCWLFFLPSFLPPGKQSQLLLKPTEVELGFKLKWSLTKSTQFYDAGGVWMSRIFPDSIVSNMALILMTYGWDIFLLIQKSPRYPGG